MSSPHDDPLFSALDRAADLVDRVPDVDRMPDIRRRVRAAHRRRTRVLAVAGVVAVAGGAVLWTRLPMTGTHQTSTARPSMPPTATITQPVYTVAGRRTADLDGDGRPDRVRLRVPQDPDYAVSLDVHWGGGGQASALLPNVMERTLAEPNDLDGDGAAEVLVEGGGGETAEIRVFTAIADTLVEVEAAGVRGRANPLTWSTDSRWQLTLQDDGISSYRVADAADPRIPGPVVTRRWTLDGITLRESTATQRQCLSGSGRLGPC